MTQDKDLLLKDLCARLPYGVKYECSDIKNVWKLNSILTKRQDDDVFLDIYNPLDLCKPYLFPLSSLTEEQRNDISKLLIETQNEFSPYGKLNMKGCDNLFICTVKQANTLINYCLTYHLDINGLIEKDLAIDATGKNIY